MNTSIFRCCTTPARASWSAVVVAVLVAAFGGLIANATASQEQRRQNPLEGFPDLVSGLRATEGCIGVETARTESGKSLIFAWFENKEACIRWFYSDMHQAALATFFPEEAEEDHDHEPREEIPDEVGPILAIASMTVAADPQPGEFPFSQIAIELYTPLRGGLAVGGRFAPKGLIVPKRKIFVDEGH